MIDMDKKEQILHYHRIDGLSLREIARRTGLNDYLNEKRFLYACELLRERPQWTIEAVGIEAGFGSRRTFQMEMKRRLGITPLQYRHSK